MSKPDKPKRGRPARTDKPEKFNTFIAKESKQKVKSYAKEKKCTIGRAVEQAIDLLP